MTQKEIEEIFLYIVNQSLKLKNKYLSDYKVKIEFADIFSQSETEYQDLTQIITELGRTVYDANSGYIYKLDKPIKTQVGELYYVKIRKSDPKLRLRGDADFDTNYPALKQKYQNHLKFEHIVRDEFEMLRLSDPDFNVMTCFSNIPVRKWIKEKNNK